jgi:hypothetical protein
MGVALGGACPRKQRYIQDKIVSLEKRKKKKFYDLLNNMIYRNQFRIGHSLVEEDWISRWCRTGTMRGVAPGSRGTISVPVSNWPGRVVVARKSAGNDEKTRRWRLTTTTVFGVVGGMVVGMVGEVVRGLDSNDPYP